MLNKHSLLFTKCSLLVHQGSWQALEANTLLYVSIRIVDHHGQGLARGMERNVGIGLLSEKPRMWSVYQDRGGASQCPGSWGWQRSRSIDLSHSHRSFGSGSRILVRKASSRQAPAGERLTEKLSSLTIQILESHSQRCLLHWSMVGPRVCILEVRMENLRILVQLFIWYLERHL